MIITQHNVCTNCSQERRCFKNIRFCCICGTKLVSKSVDVPYNIWVIILKYVWSNLDNECGYNNCQYLNKEYKNKDCKVCYFNTLESFSEICQETHNNTYIKGSEILKMMHYRYIDYIDKQFENSDTYLGLPYFKCLNFMNDYVNKFSDRYGRYFDLNDDENGEKVHFSSYTEDKEIKILIPKNLEDVLYFNKLENEINLVIKQDYTPKTYRKNYFGKQLDIDDVIILNNHNKYIKIHLEIMNKKYNPDYEIYDNDNDDDFMGDCPIGSLIYYRFPQIIKCEKCAKITYSDNIYYDSKDLYKIKNCDDCTQYI
jgi:hypothetical protein